MTEPKTALAGVALDISFARFVASMAAFSKERALSRRWACCLESVSMVENQGSWEITVWGAGCAEGPEPQRYGGPFCRDTPHANGGI